MGSGGGTVSFRIVLRFRSFRTRGIELVIGGRDDMSGSFFMPFIHFRVHSSQTLGVKRTEKARFLDIKGGPQLIFA